ncbi:LegC family aminotransferase, partial [Rhodospirillales bacterium]|nr:LegC family aminotransferase [Rhodospirillales bacterium]
EMIASYTGSENVIATGTGTQALHAALIVANVQHGDEVIIPALTFVATANAVAQIGAIPHIADIEAGTLGLDPTKLRSHLEAIVDNGPDGLINTATGRKISGVICMHTFGHPCDLEGLLNVCQQFDIPLIEDAAESLGSFYKDQHTGNFGLISTLSFNGNKTITTGGGGAIMTNDRALADRVRHLTRTAKQAHNWEFIHDQVGYNYRLPNLNAALGCAQMEALPGYLSRKRTLADRYHAAFAEMPGVKSFAEPDGCKSNYWLNAILLDPADAGMRDDVLQATNEAGYMTRPAWRPMHMLPMFTDCPRTNLDVSEDIYARLINIPSSSQLALRA